MENIHLKEKIEVKLRDIQGVAACQLNHKAKELYCLDSDLSILVYSFGAGLDFALQKTIRTPKQDSKLIYFNYQSFFERFVLVFEERILQVELNGATKTVDNAGCVAAGLSPDEEWLLTVQKTQLQSFSKHLKPGKTVELGREARRAEVAFRADSACAMVAVESEEGCKIACYSKAMDNICSKVKYDPAYELVTNVFEKEDKGLRTAVCFLNDSFMIATLRHQPDGAQSVLFIESNCLTYEQFDIPAELAREFVFEEAVSDRRGKVLLLVGTSPARKVCFFLQRKNAQWVIKKRVVLPRDAQRLQLLNDNTLLVNDNKGNLQFYEYHSVKDCFEHSHGSALVVFYEYPLIKATPLDKYLIPHPQSLL